MSKIIYPFLCKKLPLLRNPAVGLGLHQPQCRSGFAEGRKHNEIKTIN